MILDRCCINDHVFIWFLHIFVTISYWNSHYICQSKLFWLYISKPSASLLEYVVLSDLPPSLTLHVSKSDIFCVWLQDVRLLTAEAAARQSVLFTGSILTGVSSRNTPVLVGYCEHL